MASSQPSDELRLELVDEACCEQFEAAWLNGEKQSIATCLPARHSDRYLPTLEELVCIQMELQWKVLARSRELHTLTGTGTTLIMRPSLVEDYTAEFPPLGQAELCQRLIRQEYLIRNRLGEDVTAEEYHSRFPDLNLEAVLPETEHDVDAGLYEANPAEADQHDEVELPGYEVLGRLGAGGMGVVFKARQVAADRVVALKLIRSHRLQGGPERQEILDRFCTEALATAKLDHPECRPGLRS